MRTVVALVLAVGLVTGACQTRSGALTGGVISTIVAGGAFYASYDARNDDEGIPIIVPLAGLVFGAIGVGSFLEAASIDDDPKPAPGTGSGSSAGSAQPK